MEELNTNHAEMMEAIDRWLAYVPDADHRRLLRQVFESACQTVENEHAELMTLRSQAEAAKQSYQSQIRELETEREALAAEAIKFSTLKEGLTKGLSSQFEALTNQMINLAEDVRVSKSTAADTLQAANDAASANNAQNEAAQFLKEDLVGRFERVSASVEAVVTTLNNVQGETTKCWKATESIVADQQLAEDTLDGINTSFNDLQQSLHPLMDETKAIKESLGNGLKQEVLQPLVDETNTIKRSVAAIEADQQITYDGVKGLEGSVDGLKQSLQPLACEIESIKEALRGGLKQDALQPLMDETSAINEALAGSLQGDALQPLLAETAAIRESVAALPSVTDIGAAYNERLTDEYTANILALRRERNTQKDAADRLRGERDQLRTEVTDITRQLEEAMAALEPAIAATDNERNRVQRRNARIRDLSTTLTAAEQDLAEARPLLEQREADRRDLAAVRGQLDTVQARVGVLTTNLDQSQRHHQECSGQLQEAQAKIQEYTVETQQLQSKLNTALEQLNDLRSQQAQNHQVELRRQWDIEREGLIQQLGNQRSQETDTLHRELKESWANEKLALNGQLTDKIALINSQRQEIETMNYKLSDMEHLTLELEKSKSDLERAKQSLSSLTQASEATLLESTQKATRFESDLAEAKAEIERVHNELQETNSQLVENGNLVQDLRTQLSKSTTEMEAICEAHPVLSLREEEIGGLAKVYLELADEFYDLPVNYNPDKRDEMLQTFVEVAPLLNYYSAKDNIILLMHSNPQGWYCLQEK
ncbi:hypothetical protein FPSE_10359 [Fusarium pseudograminearum CS3096]|uniref:Uncharacterized protein n=1 Tax=Fusarium pseudograminearum (strain CS3096) TaxID=1028729 RepID=K3V882_FUSPC|nr:hypothetical protein FPSE_10359 [Fusarium pseudograminearum CS3096]EKJ69459.1 hypothetical protein FPSE_10359 [Fusarium pseudograminearum CS3096]